MSPKRQHRSLPLRLHSVPGRTDVADDAARAIDPNLPAALVHDRVSSGEAIRPVVLERDHLLARAINETPSATGDGRVLTSTLGAPDADGSEARRRRGRGCLSSR